MSWEKEEHRSRHVDFQCVKSKSFNQLPVEQINLNEINNFLNENEREEHELEIEIPPGMVDQVDGIAPLNHEN